MKAKKVMKEGWKKNGRVRKVKHQKKSVCVKNNDVIQMEDSQKRHKKSSMKRRRRKEKKRRNRKKGKITRKKRSKKENLSNAEEVNK